MDIRDKFACSRTEIVGARYATPSCPEELLLNETIVNVRDCRREKSGDTIICRDSMRCDLWRLGARGLVAGLPIASKIKMPRRTNVLETRTGPIDFKKSDGPMSLECQGMPSCGIV